MANDGRDRCGLLVSVRSAAEGEAALAGGAGLIDVKEPAHGSLGRAADDVIAAVLRVVGATCPVSAALGELRENARPCTPTGLTFAKWGLAGSGCSEDWQRALLRSWNLLAETDPDCRPVAVAYADWQRAAAPSPRQVWQFAASQRRGPFLLDTWAKDGTGLTDWLSQAEIAEYCRLGREHGVPVALAGSLGPAEIETLRPLAPTWFAVRGAACRHRRREAAIDPEAVRRLTGLLHGAVRAASAGS